MFLTKVQNIIHWCWMESPSNKKNYY